MLFLGVCILLAVLVLVRIIKILVLGLVFATALVVLGLLSQGFKKAKQ